jgi:ubiquinone/menaquinone biosynthesis C-methylase UbiE
MSKTSWGGVADWYDQYLKDEDSYQNKVILPNLERVLSLDHNNSLLDIGCGQGYFSLVLAKKVAKVIGLDISPELVSMAKEQSKKLNLKNTTFGVSPASDLSSVPDQSIDKAICILAAQNIEDLDKVFLEISRVLKKDGSFVMVINHPSFRIPQASDWHFNDSKRVGDDPNIGKQGRVVYQYLSEGKIKIDMNPGSTFSDKKGYLKPKKYTISYHRPLQVFIKWLSKANFAVTRLEEWSSHKKSQSGPKAKIEDIARKEIPLFMCLGCIKIK